MHSLGEEIAQCGIDHPLALDAILTAEGGRDDLDREVTFAACIVAGMTGMVCAVVDHGEPFGGQGGTQPPFDFGRDGASGRFDHRAYITGFREESLADETRPRTPRFHGRIPTGRLCAEPGCTEPGEFRAPAEGSRSGFDGPGEWRWLCLDHVRAFNARYNFFDGMSPDEINEAQRPYAGWERETRAFSTGGADRPPRWADFSDPLDAISARFRAGTAAVAQRKDGKPLSGEDRQALGVMGLEIDADRKGLRTRYAELLRRYHPDRNGGDRSHERKLQGVVEAYQHLRKSPAFA